MLGFSNSWSKLSTVNKTSSTSQTISKEFWLLVGKAKNVLFEKYVAVCRARQRDEPDLYHAVYSRGSQSQPRSVFEAILYQG